MFQDLATPIIWGSFITGLPLEKHGFKLKYFTKPHKLLRFVPEKLRHKIPFETRKRFFRATRIKKEQRETYEEIRRQFKNKNLTTLFNIPNSVAISVPPYQRWTKPRTIRLMREMVEKKIPFVLFEEHVRSTFLRKKRKLLDAVLRGDWRLLMAHFMFTDLLAHFKIRNKQKMLEIYSEAGSLVEEVKDNLGGKRVC